METQCVEVLSPDTQIDVQTQDNIEFYLKNIEIFTNLSSNIETYDLNYPYNSDVYYKNIFTNRHMHQINNKFIFRTDLTHYFIANPSTIESYIEEIKRDLDRCIDTIIIFDKLIPTYVKLNNKESINMRTQNSPHNYLSVLNYGICLMNMFFDAKLTNLTDKNCSNKHIRSINIKTQENINNNTPPNKLNKTKKKQIQKQKQIFSKSFNEIVIPSNDSNKILEPHIITTIKCILSNLVFINASYQQIFTTILNYYYESLITIIKENINNVTNCFINIKPVSDYFINKDLKTFNLFIDIFMVIEIKGLGKTLSINMGQIIHVIYFNSFDKIDSIAKTFNIRQNPTEHYNSHIIIETNDNFTTDEKCFNFISNLMLFNKKTTSKTTTHISSLNTYINTIPKDIHEAIPANLHNITSKKNIQELYTIMSGYSLTELITTIFNFIIHISPYKKFITKELFNLKEKDNYNNNNTEFTNFDDFENSPNKPHRIEQTYELSYKIFICDNDKEYKDGNFYLGKKLLEFFDDKQNKNIFVGFIMNRFRWKMFGITGHLNTLIIDKKHKQIIRFEPKGKDSFFGCNIKKEDIYTYIVKSITKFVKNTKNLSAIRRDDPDIKLYEEIIKEYTYIDTSNKTNIITHTKNFHTKSVNNMPQKGNIFGGGDNYCQTYSLYGALLYCMNYNTLIEFETDMPKYIYSIITLFEQIQTDKQKAIKLQYFLKNKLEKLMPNVIKEIDSGLQKELSAENKKKVLSLENYEAPEEDLEIQQVPRQLSEIQPESEIQPVPRQVSEIQPVSPQVSETTPLLQKKLNITNTKQTKTNTTKKNYTTKKNISTNYSIQTPIIEYTDEIKTINTKLQTILDIIVTEIKNRINTNNRTVITKILQFYIDQLQTSKNNSKNNLKVKTQYEKVKQNLGFFSKSKIHNTPEAQLYYKLLLEANFVAKIITLTNNNYERKKYMLNRFNMFLNNNPKYNIDIFNKETNGILTAIESLKLKNNKTKKNNVSNTGNISKLDINILNTQEHKTKIINIIDSFTSSKCNNNKLHNKLNDNICQNILSHVKNLEDSYTAYLNSQKLFSKTKKNQFTLEQSYYRLLLECDLISEIIRRSIKLSLTDIEEIITDLINFIINKPNYSIANFNYMKLNIFKQIISINQRQSIRNLRSTQITNNINRLNNSIN